MKKFWKALGLAVSLGVLSASLAQAEWAHISQRLMEQDILHVASDIKDPKIILAVSDKHVYRTEDTGRSWKQVPMGISAGERITSIYKDPVERGMIYVPTDRKIYRSKNAGKSWEVFFLLTPEQGQKIFCIGRDTGHSEILWIGTDRGLLRMDIKKKEVYKISGLPDTEVRAIVFDPMKRSAKMILTAKGIYRDATGSETWQKVSADRMAGSEESELPAQQFGVEESSFTLFTPNIVFMPEQNRFYAATSRGLLQSADEGYSWRPAEGNLPDKKVNFIVAAQKTFYVATDHGVFRWSAALNRFEEIYLGLGSNEVHSLDYNPSGNYLLAATAKGIYLLSNPELSFLSSTTKEFSGMRPDIHFANEPTILEIQQAAIRYAEVNPEKIEAWRKAASRKAWAPSLTFHQDFEKNQNIDIDRGGTNDPDKFIYGPEEKSADWYVSASWDLGELIWNNDQTSIDSRSKLMVELRNDILSEVTHIYYERKRLQIQMATEPAEDKKLQIENQIRLEELTSGIDALTGGYLSKRLSTAGLISDYGRS